MHLGWYAQSHRTICSVVMHISIPTHVLTLHGMQAKKDPTLRSLESRLRNARYLGELAKFRLAPFGTIFVMLKVCEESRYRLTACFPHTIMNNGSCAFSSPASAAGIECWWCGQGIPPHANFCHHNARWFCSLSWMTSHTTTSTQPVLC